MGSTEAPTEVPQNEKVILCGGGLPNAVLFSVAAAMRQQSNQIVYFAAYRKAGDLSARTA
jgi:1,6-anhydro-N-acetylmuramate kinase